MRLYLVTFDVPDAQRVDFVNKLKAQGSWARITPTSWCLKVENRTVAQLRDTLSEGLNDSEKIFVVDVTNSSWASYFLPPEVANWIKQS